MQILMKAGGIAVTNCFLIVDDETKQAVLFDAPNDTVAQVLDDAQKNGWDIVGLWFTHGHFDHVADHKVVTDRFPNCKVAIHRLDHPKLQNPMDSVFPIPFDIPPRDADILLEDGQKLQIGKINVVVMHTPGHCAGHVVYHLPDEKKAVGGDLIIMGAVGRTDLPDSNSTQLVSSIQRVMQLPGQTQLLPGHGEPSTLKEERENNFYVQEALKGSLW